METMATVMGLDLFGIYHYGALIAYTIAGADSDGERWICDVPTKFSSPLPGICHAYVTTFRAWRRAFIDRTGDGNFTIMNETVPF